MAGIKNSKEALKNKVEKITQRLKQENRKEKIKLEHYQESERTEKIRSVLEFLCIFMKCHIF